MLIACDRDQAKIVEGYTRSFFTEITGLASMVTRETPNGFELSNGVSISVMTNSHRRTRGRTVLMAVLDECAFYRDENSASPDVELYRALSPSLSTIPGSMLCMISSPYKRSGLLYDKWKSSFGKDDDRVLVIQAPSLALNPLLDPAEIEADRAADPQAAKSEWDGLWRDDVASYVPVEIVEQAVDHGVVLRPPISGVGYVAFVDPSGGSGQDSFCLAVAHKEGARFALDCLIEKKPPFSPEATVRELAATVNGYRCGRVAGDHWANGVIEEMFKRHGVAYVVAPKVKSEIYRDLLPLLNSGVVDLLDNRKLVAQLASLERRTVRGGRESIDHPRGLHDDLANAVAGALTLAALGRAPMRINPAALASPDRLSRQLALAAQLRTRSGVDLPEHLDGVAW